MKPDTRVRPDGVRFVDAAGRQIVLRGVNLGGDCKVPYPEGGTDRPGSLDDSREISFVGRPFPLAEADRHLARLRTWGFNCVRLLTTWEAVEHAGPGQYDEAYLDYLAELVRRLGDHGLQVVVDFHQDAWSRMTGGDGAPGWTLEAAGLDVARVREAGAAHVMQWAYDYDDPAPRQASYPQMSWSRNYQLPANGVLWTLFWAGRRLTPGFERDGQNIQDVLQGGYLRAVGQVARRLSGMRHVLGFDTLNEPGLGWIGQPLSYRHVAPSAANPGRARPGPALSPLDSLLAARGQPVAVPWLERDTDGIAQVIETRTFNPTGAAIWRDGHCPFEAAGVYRLEAGRAVALDEAAFARVDPATDAFQPFFHALAETIRAHDAEWAVFAEMDPYGVAGGRRFPEGMPAGWVNASHWYDYATLFGKAFRLPAGGREALRDRYIRELAAHRQLAPSGEPAPDFVGEFGIPFDLEGGRAFARWAAGERTPEIWREHVLALTLMYEALDALGLSGTLWNYTASNRNDLRIGDGWNQEDLSIWSTDQVQDPARLEDGARAQPGWQRPYPSAIQGRLERFSFDAEAGVLEMCFQARAAIPAPTEICLPLAHFPGEPIVSTQGAPVRYALAEDPRRLCVWAGADGRVSLDVRRGRPA